MRARAVLVPAEPGHDAVGCSLVLDLEHCPLAGLVRRVEPLRDDAVETGALEAVEPVGSERDVGRGRRQVNGRRRTAQDPLEPGSTLALRDAPEILVAERQQVPGHERRRLLRGQHRDAGRRGMDAQEQALEVEPIRPADDHFAVEHASRRQVRAKRRRELREVAVERLEVAALRVDLISVPEDDRPKAVPLGLEEPALAGRERVGELGEHRFEGRLERKLHVRDYRPGPIARARRWHDCPTMTSIAERYDYSADRYERWWAPVLAPTALGLLDRLAPQFAAQPDARVLDVGTGSGTLALGILERWPDARVVGIDASAGMLDVARARALERLGDVADRLTLIRAEADSLPSDPESFDLVVSSFVFQLVPDRRAALLEARRVLRPGGLLAVVCWLVDERRFEPDEAFEDALDDLDVDFPDDDEEPRSGNYASPEAAATQARRAGFKDVRAIRDELVHAYEPAEYLQFLEEYAELGLFESLDARDRTRLRHFTERRLGRLPRSDFVWRAGVVTLLARRP